MINITKAILRVLIRLLFRLQIEGLHNLDFSRRLILMPNHVSLIDGLLLALYVPDGVTFVVNTEIGKRFALPLKLVPHILIDPLNPYSIRRMVRLVSSGTPLVIFPEGRVSTTGGFMKVYPGVAYIALKTEADLYPVAIDGTERSKFSYLNDKWKTRWFPRLRIRIGTAFQLEGDKQMSMRRQKEAAADRIYRRLQEELLALRLKPQVNLFNELWQTARTNALQMEVAEDLTQRITYRKLLIGVYALSRKLQAKLQSQDTVAVLLPNAIGHVVTLFALFYQGKTPAILNFSAGKQSLLDACETAPVRTILTSRAFIAKGKLEPLVEALSVKADVIYLEDIRASVGTRVKAAAMLDYFRRRKSAKDGGEVILFTSGSENKPKGVVLTHANLYANILQARCAMDFTSQDKLLNALPMFHSFGLTAGTLLPLLTGLKLYLYPSPLHYRVIPELIYERSATILLGTSTFLAAYGKHAHPYDMYRIRYAVAGGEKLKDEVRALWQEKFGIRLLEGYGTTETAPILSLNTPLFNQKGTVGRFLPGVRYRIDPVEGIAEGGSLFVQGPNVMKGYLIHGQGFVPCGDWYDCGDVVQVDKGGFVTIHSRLKRFAKIGGEMVSLNLTEEVALRSYPDAQLAAISLPDARKGERIVLYHNAPDLTVGLLKQMFAQRGYSPMIAPSYVHYLEKLPLLGSGKTDYVTLKMNALSTMDKGD
jgi:acyl-[acyl-carrier-protein]-phospholipid O-acyltransferase/long-chain-fatty-acid--[acyl-carrier-protein] ligase